MPDRLIAELKRADARLAQGSFDALLEGDLLRPQVQLAIDMRNLFRANYPSIPDIVVTPPAKELNAPVATVREPRHMTATMAQGLARVQAAAAYVRAQYEARLSESSYGRKRGRPAEADISLKRARSPAEGKHWTSMT